MNDIRAKIILVGESGVGKTSLMVRYVDGRFKLGDKHTVGTDVMHKATTVLIEDPNTHETSSCSIKLEIWDTGGQERFRTITSSYYRTAAGIILAFDLTDAQSFNRVTNWMDDIKMYANSDAVVVLVGTKSDLDEERVVNIKEIKMMVEQLGIPYVETTSKDGLGVEEVFNRLASGILTLRLTHPSKNDSDSNGKINNAQFYEDGNAKSRKRSCGCVVM